MGVSCRASIGTRLLALVLSQILIVVGPVSSSLAAVKEAQARDERNVGEARDFGRFSGSRATNAGGHQGKVALPVGLVPQRVELLSGAINGALEGLFGGSGEGVTPVGPEPVRFLVELPEQESIGCGSIAAT